MDLYKKCLILTAGISIVTADFRYEHYKTFSFHGNDNPSRKPWFLDDYSVNKPEPSESVAHYAHPYDDNVKHGSIHIPTYRDYSPYSSSDSFFSSTKKVPKEDKAFKKAISPFYTITDKDSAKYKELVLKSGLPYCQEVKSKTAKVEDSQDRPKRETMTCYKCKDPKNGSTYEHCSYSSQPQASSKMETFEHVPSRLRRSNEELDSSEEESAPAALTLTDKLKEPYRFSEEYFLPQASRKFSTEHTTKDSCERVIRDSMVCMVCKNLKTSGKYEQCSYIAEPDEKAYAYTKSSSFGKPSKTDKSASLKKRDYKKPAPTHESLESSEYGGKDVLEKRPRQAVKDATGSSECKQVQRDSEICTVCKDPKTGGNSEKCSYAYEPDDKVYKFTRSRSFGYPESSEKNSSGENDDDKEVSESDPKESTSYSDEDSGYDDYTGYQKPKEGDSSEESEKSPSYGSSESKESQAYDYDPVSADYIKSESEKILKDAESTNCKKVQKDSMICTVCKDQKTGGNSESCTYSYQPDDKKFSYTKSKSFGSPTENRGGKQDYSEEGNPYGSSEYSDDGSYGYATEIKPTVSSPNGKKQVAADSKTQGVVSLGGTAQAPVSKVDLEFLGTSRRKAEIEKFLKEFQAEDRTKCQKIMREKMTCYQCVDENGFRKEECMFITAPEKQSKNRVTYRESKELKLDPKPEAASSSDILKTTKKPTKIEVTKTLPLEPAASASEDSYSVKKQSKKKNDDEKNNDDDDDVDEHENDDDDESDSDSTEHKEHKDDHKEAEPYEYVAETKYKYDKVLGLTLPAYMLETSDFEKEFDEIYTASIKDGNDS